MTQVLSLMQVEDERVKHCCELLATVTSHATARQRYHFTSYTRVVNHMHYHTSQFKYHTSHITHHTSHITHHTSHITHHTSHITHHTSHITHHTSLITHHTPFLQLDPHHPRCRWTFRRQRRHLPPLHLRDHRRHGCQRQLQALFVLERSWGGGSEGGV